MKIERGNEGESKSGRATAVRRNHFNQKQKCTVAVKWQGPVDIPGKPPSLSFPALLATNPQR